MTDEILTLEEAAAAVKLSTSAMYRAARRGEFGSKLEGQWRVYESELHDWYERCRPISRERQPDPMPSTRRSEAASLRELVRA